MSESLSNHCAKLKAAADWELLQYKSSAVASMASKGVSDLDFLYKSGVEIRLLTIDVMQSNLERLPSPVARRRARPFP